MSLCPPREKTNREAEEESQTLVLLHESWGEGKKRMNKDEKKSQESPAGTSLCKHWGGCA